MSIRVVSGAGSGISRIAHQDELADLVAAHGVAIGILTTPPDVAQQVANDLVAAGVRSILSFAPTVVEVPDGVLVRHVDVASELEILAFHEGRRGPAMATPQL